MNNTEQKQLDYSTIRDKIPFSQLWKQSLSSVPLAQKSLMWGVGAVILLLCIFWLIPLIVNDISNNIPLVVYTIIMLISYMFIVISAPIIMNVRKLRTYIRGSSFAGTNGFEIIKTQNKPSYSGIIFDTGFAHQAESIVVGQYIGRNFQIFNYEYSVNNGKNTETVNDGIIMIKLPRRLPQVIFDGKEGDFFGINSLGVEIRLPSSSQKIELEGDFNKYYNVYAPQGYERDILYFLTPELMEILINKGSKDNLEIVDDNLFIYREKAFEYTQSEMKNIFDLIKSIGGEFAENVTGYSDERVGDRQANQVAVPGERLKKNWFWVSNPVLLIIFVVFMIVMLIPVISAVFYKP